MLSKFLGGLLGDVVEGVKYVGNEIIDAPGEFIDGVNEGLFTKEDEQVEANAVTPGQKPDKAPEAVADVKVNEVPVEEEIAALKAKLAALESTGKDAEPAPFKSKSK